MHRRTAPVRLALALLLAVTGVAAGCGGGTIGVATATATDEPGSANAPTSAGSVAVTNTKVDPATVTFVLTDAESDPASVRILFSLLGDGSDAVDLDLNGAPPLNSLQSSPTGTLHTLEWNFASQLGGGFRDGVTVFVVVGGGDIAVSPGASAVAPIGNDVPIVPSSDVTAPLSTPLGEDVVGVADVAFRVFDSPDVVDVRVEFNSDAEGGFPESSWALARPGGATNGAPLPADFFAFENVLADEDGTTLTFFWNVLADLGNTEGDVKLRFTARDKVGSVEVSESVPGESPVFRVDNNAPPVAALDFVAIADNADRQRGIAVPVVVRDDESDPVDLVFQVVRAGSDFPDLPTDAAAVRAALDDPVQREALAIADEFPVWIGGRIKQPDFNNALVLPELALGTVSTPAGGVIGRQLELLRAANVARTASSSWAANPLTSPTAVLATTDAFDVLVLDEPVANQWRLRVVDLETGAVESEVATSTAGRPSAMCYEPGRSSVLVTSNVLDVWSIDRVRLSDGAVTRLVTADGTSTFGTVQGIVGLARAVTSVEGDPIDRGSALVAVDDALVRVHFDSVGATSQQLTLVSGLVEPRGLTRDPLDADRVFFAEAGAGADLGRVSAFDLDTLLSDPIADQSSGLARPTSIAVDASGDRLLVLTDAATGDGEREIRTLGLGVTGDLVTLDTVPDSAVQLASGPDGMVLAALQGSDDIAVMGGVEQRRTIEDVVPFMGEQVTVLDEIFEPQPVEGQRWRISLQPGTVAADPVGTRVVFVLDTGTDFVDEEGFIVRVTPLDSDAGFQDSDRIAKGRAFSSGTPLGASGHVLTEDLDGDGDADILVGGTLFFQNPKGAFGPGLGLAGSGARSAVGDLDQDGRTDIVLATGSSLQVLFNVGGPFFVNGPNLGVADAAAVADLNGDGAADIVAVENPGASPFESGIVNIYFQTSPGNFTLDPAGPITNGIVTSTQVDVTVGDLDGDGDVDILTANRGVFAQNGTGDTLAIYRQLSPGVFARDSDIIILGSSANTRRPTSVAIGDLDGDGDNDIVCTNGGDPLFPPIPGQGIGPGEDLRIFFQTTPGSFPAASSVALGGPGITPAPSGVRTGDVDADGDLDLVCLSGGEVAIFLQQAPGVFELDPNGFLTDGSGAVALGDADGDGDLDIVRASEVLTQSGPANFSLDSSVTLGGQNLTERPQAIAAVDLDGDGDLDLATANRTGSGFGGQGNVTIFFQEGPGAYATQPLAVGQGELASLAAADLEGDGDIDLIAGGSFGGVFLFRQVSPGVFGDGSFSPLGEFIPGPIDDLAAGDLDTDGLLDIVVANRGTGTVSIYRQTSSGSFETTPSVDLGGAGVTDGPSSVEIVDVDGDDRVDIICTNEDGDDVTIFYQDAAGAFAIDAGGPLGGAGVTDAPVSLAVADLDGDGDLDIACANRVGNDVVLFLQTAPRTFVLAPSGPLTGISSPLMVVACDLNADQRTDLALANASGDRIAVFVQTAPGVLVRDESSTLALSLNATSLAAADTNGDGDVDLAVASDSDDEIYVLFNSHE